MEILLIGISHKTAPIEVREKFYLRILERELFLSKLHNSYNISDAIVLSTCNRTEIYVSTANGEDTFDILISLLFKIKNQHVSLSLKKYFYKYIGTQAIKHLLRVSTGLESLVLGERQILGQVKIAVELSRQNRMLSRTFNLLTNITIRAGKKARNETQISYGGGSIGWAGVIKAETELGTLNNRSILIIGAGKMSKLTVNHLKNKGINKIYVMNRTQKKAFDLAEKFGGIAASFCDIKEILSEIDVCICSVSAPHYILDKVMVEKVMPYRKDKKLVFIDISMPRNLDPQIATIDNVELYSIDDLGKTLRDNMNKRYAAISQVENIISNKISEFYNKLNRKENLIIAEMS